MPNELTYSQAMDLAKYFLGPHHLVYQPNPYVYAVWDRTTLLTISTTGWDDALQRVGAWPDEFIWPPPAPRYVSIHSRESPGMAQVMRGGTCIAVATSHNAGKIIANALNRYKPGRRGS